MNRIEEEICRAALAAVAEEDDGRLLRRFRFSPGFVGFQGHFPGYPVVPAIVQLLAAQGVALSRLSGTVRLAAVENAKFLIQLRPEEEIVVSCRLRNRGEESVAHARIDCVRGLAAVFDLIFAPERSRS